MAPRQVGSMVEWMFARTAVVGRQLGLAICVVASAGCLMPDVKVRGTESDARRRDDAGLSDAGRETERDAQLTRADGGSDAGDPKPTSSKAPEMSSMTSPNIARCAPKVAMPARGMPSVHFLVDASGSMNASFGDGTRWSELRKALLETGGVVETLDDRVSFGLTIYNNNDPMTCPLLTEVAPAPMNLANLRAAFPAMELGGGTPTGEALQQIVDTLP
ncbi:MAG TPA: vWA domain-containing protein, partial [Polyangiales bacterium]|nr:vWA domain-containing protein [Polyangiales bacterium]